MSTCPFETAFFFTFANHKNKTAWIDCMNWGRLQGRSPSHLALTLWVAGTKLHWLPEGHFVFLLRQWQTDIETQLLVLINLGWVFFCHLDCLAWPTFIIIDSSKLSIFLVCTLSVTYFRLCCYHDSALRTCEKCRLNSFCVVSSGSRPQACAPQKQLIDRHYNKLDHILNVSDATER